MNDLHIDEDSDTDELHRDMIHQILEDEDDMAAHGRCVPSRFLPH